MHSSAYSNVCGRLKYSTKLYLANHGKGFKNIYCLLQAVRNIIMRATYCYQWEVQFDTIHLYNNKTST